MGGGGSTGLVQLTHCTRYIRPLQILNLGGAVGVRAGAGAPVNGDRQTYGPWGEAERDMRRNRCDGGGRRAGRRYYATTLL